MLTQSPVVLLEIVVQRPQSLIEDPFGFLTKQLVDIFITELHNLNRCGFQSVENCEVLPHRIAGQSRYRADLQLVLPL